ncbi:MAG TPA: SEC-C metal-binding domain-containing protein [Methanomethylovorans sp.]|nr:SEC-C metal-binding domain-containing protein [Methanomethylovorans sp.]
MNRYKIADEMIQLGYKHIEMDETVKACDAWLSAWEEIKLILDEEKITDLQALEKEYEWTEFLSNYIQDVEMELHNAGLENEKYIHKRIKYCNEMIKLCDQEDKLIIENSKRAIADSYFALGDTEECDKLYSQWLNEDPAWGWGYIGWADCYGFGTKKIKPYLNKAEEIIRRAVEKKDVHDRIDVLMRAIEIYSELKQTEKADELKKEMKQLEKLPKRAPIVNAPFKTVKVGRNDPCPCGSGKKYKKCCGK